MKKFGYYLVFASLAASLAFMSCNDEGRNNNNGNGNGNGGTDENNVYLKNPPKNGDVYVGGFEGRFAVTWKNGEELASTDGSGIAVTNSIFVSGKDVYEVGNTKTETSGTKGILWKNGVVDGNTYGGNPRSVFVTNNGDIYVTGGLVWKNGVEQQGYNGANSVFLFRGDIYVAGYRYGQYMDLNGSYYYNNRAFLLKNGAGQNLSFNGVTNMSIANSVVVSNAGDVYVAGSEGGCAAVWINGAVQRLSGKVGIANSMVILSNDVYVVGTDGGFATIWVNGVAQKLSEKASVANSVVVANGNVYVAGHEFVAANRNAAVLWKNGVAQYLTDGIQDASAASVFVVE